MWSLVIDELLVSFTGNGVTCLEYADDMPLKANSGPSAIS